MNCFIIKKKIYNFYKDFKDLSFYSKLIIFTPIAFALGPLIIDGIVTILSIFFLIELFKKKKLINKFFLIFSIYWIILIISSLSNYSQSSNVFIHSITNSVTTIRFGIFFIIISTVCLEEKKFIEFFKKIIFLTLIFIIFHTLLIYFFRFDFLRPFDFQNFHFKNLFYRIDELLNSQIGEAIHWTDHRISGIFYKELVLGSYLLKIGFIYLAITFINSDNFNYKNLIFIIILLFTIFITGDRSPTFLGTLGVLIFLIISNIKFLKKIIIFFSIIVLLSFSLITNPNLKDRFINQVQDYHKNSSSFIRIFDTKIWWFSEGHAQHVNTAINIFKDNKLLGTGPRTFRYSCRDDKYNLNIYSCTTHPHNTYAELLSDTGILGFLLILSLFFFVCYKMIKNFFCKKEIKNYNFKQLIAILTFLILFPYIPTGSFFNNVSSSYNYLILGFFVYSIKKTN